MSPYDLLTKADLAEFEKRFLTKITDLVSDLKSKESNSEKEDFLTRKQVIQHFGISENTFVDILNKGLPHIIVGKRARYDRKEVIAFLKSQSGNPSTI